MHESVWKIINEADLASQPASKNLRRFAIDTGREYIHDGLAWQNVNITHRGAWSGIIAYQKQDIVTNAGSAWRAFRPNIGVTPVEGADWTIFASKGDTGATGAAGSQGPMGYAVLNGSGAPSAGAGQNGDFYINTAANTLYGPKTAGAWGSPTSLVGPTGPTGVTGAAGADGKTVRNGSGAPSSSLGVDGDFYIDNTAHAVYGPKTAGAWGSATSLVGPQGPAGPTFTGGTLTSPLVLSGDASAALNPVSLQQWQTKRWKPPARFATTAALPAYTASGNTLTANANGAFPTTDSETPALGDRVLVLFEGTGATPPAIGGSSVNNGLFTITQLGTASLPWILTRDVWADTSAKVTSGMTVWVTQGTLNGQIQWDLTTADPITLGTTALRFARAIQVGTGLTRTGPIIAPDLGAAATQLAAGNRGLPAGGTTGQVPQKNSATDYDVSWGTIAGGSSTDKLTTADLYSDWAASGSVPATSANLTTTTPAQVIYLGGNRVSLASESHTYGASVTTFIDATPAGAFVYTTGALTAGNMRLYSVVTSASAITAVNDIRTRHVFETWISGLNFVWGSPGTNANNLTVTGGSVWIPDAGKVIINPGGLTFPSAAFAASTWYYGYAYNNGGVLGLDPLSTTAPVAYRNTARMKPGDPSRRYIGCVKTDASGTPKMWNFIRIGNLVKYREGFNQVPFLVANAVAASATPQTIACSPVVPPTSQLALCSAQAGANYLTFGTLDGADASGSSPYSQGLYQFGLFNGPGLWINLDASQQLRIAAIGASTENIAVMGYWEER